MGTRAAVLLALLTLSVLAVAPPPASAAHGPLHISSNGEFAARGWSGSGTSADPYRPPVTSIVASGGYGIEISGTTVHVNLSGLTITGGGSHSDGIRLTNVRNVVVWGSTLESNRYGIHVKSSTDVTIGATTVKTSQVGVLLEGSQRVTLRDDRLSLNDRDVQFTTSTGNTLVNNNLSVASGQFGLYFADNTSYDNAIDTTNVVNGIPIRWYTGLKGTASAPVVISDVTVDLPRMTNVAQIMVHASEHVRLDRPVAKAGFASGIHVHESADVELVQPVAEGNGGNGIFVEKSDDVGIASASARNNTLAGILLRSSADAEVSDAAATGNGGPGVRVAAGSDRAQLQGLLTQLNQGGGVAVESARNVSLEDSTLHADAPQAVALDQAHDVVVARNRITGGGGVGVSIARSFGTFDENVVQGRSAAFAFASATGSELTRNTITLPRGGFGLTFDGPASYDNAIATNNTVNGTAVRWYTRVSGPVTLDALRVEVAGITNVAQIMVYRSSDVTLTSAVAANGTASGIVVHESPHTNLTDATVTSNAAQGVHAHGSRGLKLLGSAIRGSGGDGVRLVSSNGALVENTVVERSGGRGGHVETSDAPTFRGNAFAANGGAGLSLDRVGPGAAVVDNNALRGNRGGLAATASVVGSVRANTLEHNGAEGIHLVNSPGALLDANVLANHTRGIRLAGSPSTEIASTNITILAGQTAIHFDDEASYAATIPPTTTVNGVPMRWYVGASGTTVSDARMEVRGATNVAQILVYKAQNVTLQGAIAANGSERGILVLRSANVTLQDARAENNSKAGIELDLSPDARVSRTVASGNGEAGLLVKSARARLENVTAERDRIGIHAFQATDLFVHAANLSANAEKGLALVEATRGTVSSSAFRDQPRAVELDRSSGFAFRGNDVTKLANATAWHFVSRDAYANNVDETNLVDGVPMRWYYGVSGLDLQGVRAELRGLTNVAQVMVYASPGARLDDVRAANGTADGIVVLDSADVRIDRSRAANNTGDGLEGSGSSTTVRNSTMRDNGGHGLRGNGTWWLDNATLDANGGSGASFERGSAHVLASGAQRNAGHGVLAASTTALNVSRSSLQRNGAGGIGVELATGAQLYDNELASNGGAGIKLDRASGVLRLSGNVLSGHARGIELRETEFAELASNRVTIASGQTGLHFADERSYNNLVPTSNTVNGQPVHWYTTLAGTENDRIVVSGVRAELPGITNVAQVMVYRSAYVTMPDVVATNGTARGLYLYRSSAITIDGANASGNALFGVHLHATQSATVRELRAVGSGVGVHLSDSANNVVSGVNATGAATGVVLADAASRDNRVDRVQVQGSALGVRDATWNGRGLLGNNVIADAGATKRARVGLPIAFDDATSTYRLESGRITSQTWEFGDGSAPATSTSSSLHRPTHAYPALGTYVANLTVTTADGLTLRDSVLVEIVPPLSKPLVDATGGARNVTLAWSAPDSDGGRAIEKYRIYRGTNLSERTFLTEVPGSARSFVDTNLVNGRAYYYQVSAVNADGEGPKDSARATPVDVPGAPSGLLGAPGRGSVVLSWDPPADTGGLDITGYKIYRSVANRSFALAATVGNVTTHTVTGLPNGVRHTFAIRAVNDVGEGPLSGNLTSMPVGPPAAPTALRALPGDATVTLLWSAPSETGGKPITGYRVWRGWPNGTFAPLPDLVLPTASTYRVTGLSNGQTYTFAVSAQSDAGDGDRSANVTAVPAGVDTLAPVLFDRTPADGSRVVGDAGAIGAHFVDNDGVVVSSVRVELDGVAVAANVTASGFSYPLPAPLARGMHTVRVVASDPAGNVADERWSFRVLAPEDLVPVFEYEGHALSPQHAAPGGNVTARVHVRNVGFAPGVASVELTLNGNLLGDANATLDEGEAADLFVEFPAPTVLGSYALVLGGRNLTLVVAEAPLGEEPPALEAPAEPPADDRRRPERNATPPPRPLEEPPEVPLGPLAPLGALAALALLRRRKA